MVKLINKEVDSSIELLGGLGLIGAHIGIVLQQPLVYFEALQQSAFFGIVVALFMSIFGVFLFSKAMKNFESE